MQRKIKINEVENFSLLFNKFIPFLNLPVVENRKHKKIYNVRLLEFLTAEEKEKRERKFRDFKEEDFKVAIFKELEKYTPGADQKLVDNLIETYKSSGFEEIKLKTGYRLAVGLGLPSFFENGLTLHHIYGTPYIPGSSVKGLVRFVFLSKIFGIFPFEGEELKKWPHFGLKLTENRKGEENEITPTLKALAEIDKVLVESENSDEVLKKVKDRIENPKKEELENFYYLFKELFGNLYYRGRVIFADAFATEWRFKTDIMNPHFKEYYGSTDGDRKEKGLYLVGDWHNPTPIHFLVVEDAVFHFLFKVEKETFIHKEWKMNLKKLLREMLTEGLSLLGIGGKKGKGYGWFEKNS